MVDGAAFAHRSNQSKGLAVSSSKLARSTASRPVPVGDSVPNSAGSNRTAHSHNAHNLEMVTVYYRWHPCFGLSLPVRRRSKHREGERIYCETPNSRICVLPNWMLSPECSHLSRGSPLVSVEALLELHDLLVAWQAPLHCDKPSLEPSRKEGRGEEISEAAQSADASVAPQPASDDYSRRQAGGTDPGPDRTVDPCVPGKRQAGIRRGKP